MQLTGPGALKTVKWTDNQTVQLSGKYRAPETLHFVLEARWRIYIEIEGERDKGTWQDIGHSPSHPLNIIVSLVWFCMRETEALGKTTAIALATLSIVFVSLGRCIYNTYIYKKRVVISKRMDGPLPQPFSRVVHMEWPIDRERERERKREVFGKRMGWPSH